jgi:hypothetical protein
MGRCRRYPLALSYELRFTPERKAFENGVRRVATWFYKETAHPIYQEETQRRVLGGWL